MRSGTTTVEPSPLELEGAPEPERVATRKPEVAPPAPERAPIWKSRSLQLALGLILIGYGAVRWLARMGGPQGIWATLGWWAPTLTVPLHCLVSLSPVPSDLIAVANGTLYGPWLGSLLGWAGWYASAWIRFGLGRRAGRDLPVERWWGRLPRWLRALPIGHPLFLIISRYIPYVGGEIATLVPGARGVPLWRFAWCTALAIAPYAILLATLGTLLG